MGARASNPSVQRLYCLPERDWRHVKIVWLGDELHIALPDDGLTFILHAQPTAWAVRPLLLDMVLRGTFLMDDETLFRESLVRMAARATKH